MLAFTSLWCSYAVGLVTAAYDFFDEEVLEAEDSLGLRIAYHASALNITVFLSAMRRIYSSLRLRHGWSGHLLCLIRSHHFFEAGISHFLPLSQLLLFLHFSFGEQLLLLHRYIVDGLGWSLLHTKVSVNWRLILRWH